MKKQQTNTPPRVLCQFGKGVLTAAYIAATASGTLWVTGSAAQAAVDLPSACSSLQAEYPDLVGKTLVNAINPHTPGYESIDPNDPNNYIGFDIDLGEAIGECLGFALEYKSVTFAALLTTLDAGQADIVISDIYATKGRAKAADFITYLKVYDGVLVAEGNPKSIDGINTSLCGAIAAENTGYVEVPLIEALADDCKALGLPAPKIQLYDNNANCIQAILSGRADVYINDVNTVDGAVAAYPDKLDKAAAVTLPYSVGIAVPRENIEFRSAVMAALGLIQDSGLQLEMMAKWNLPADQIESPKLVLAD